METNDKASFTENFIKTFPIRKFIICFVIVAVLLYLITPTLRDLDYARMPVTHSINDKAKVVVVEGIVSGDGQYLDNILLKYDQVNCMPRDGFHKLAGYWTFDRYNVPAFNAIWVVGGCE